MFKLMLSGLLLLATTTIANAQDRKPPYWAALNKGDILMRTGPGRQFPTRWRYQRRGLPVRVIAVFETWRQVQDPDGAKGWMLSSQLTAERTAMIRPGAPRPLRAEPADDAPVRYLAQPGVVGALSACAAGWCRFEAGGRGGHIPAGDLWGVEPSETLD